MLALYTLTVLFGALLLFLVQPMAARMVLPRLGGSPAVWSTCMVFFQAALLAGYAWAHVLTRRLSARAQVALQLALVALALGFLPTASAVARPIDTGASPALGLLLWLAGSVGLPYLALATTSPLLQRWFAVTRHAAAADPYFLYAASNTGSLAALVAYPLLIEPALPLAAPSGPSQSRLFGLGYVGFALAMASCAWLMLAWRDRAAAAATTTSAGSRSPIAAKRRLLWVLLGLVPSSAMLGATQVVTSEIVAVPLLWVVPLALYLLTFILAFSRRMRIPERAAGIGLAALAVAIASPTLVTERPSAWLLVPLHFLTVFAVGCVCHGRLAADRPAPEHLTEFYLLLSLGGVLGGAFNAFVAPLVFNSVLEYPIALVAACLLRPPEKPSVVPVPRMQARLVDVLVVAGLGLVAELLLVVDWGPAVEIAIPGALALVLLRPPLRSAMAVALLFAFSTIVLRVQYPPLHTARTFFGIHRVVRGEGEPFEAVDPRTGHVESARVPFHLLVHGTTCHGSQAQLERLRAVPTSYYHRSGPIGQVFEISEPRGLADRVAVVGLGAGTLAAYGRPGQRFTFFELDDEVVAIARDERLFTYLRDCRAEVEVVTGDGRLGLAQRADGEFGLIVLDAFSSDSVPVHLITREAIALYSKKLAPDGLLALHQTSEYLDLTRVVGAIAEDLGLAGLVRRDGVGSDAERVEGKAESIWSVLARNRAALGPLVEDPRWQPLPAGAGVRGGLWTDDYSNILGVLRLGTGPSRFAG